MTHARALVGWVALGSTLALAVACRAPQRAQVTEVELWAMGREGELVGRLLPDFERRHPRIRVRVQQVPWSAAHEKLLTAYVGGAMPDVVQVGSTWVPELVALGALLPLDERVARSAVVNRADYFEGILDAHAVGGRTYSLPWYVDTRVLFYRTDLLARAGHATPPATWDGWLQAMERLAAPPERWALFVSSTDWWLPVTLGLQRGATLLRDDGRFGNFRSAPMREAFALYLDLFRRGLAPRAGASEVANLHQDFAAGYFAVFPSGPWDLGELARRLPPDLADRWGTAPMPGNGPDRPGVSIAGGAGLAVAADSPRADEAWALVEYLATPASQVALHRLTGDLPARRSAWRLAGLHDDPHLAAFWQQLGHLVSVPKVAEWERIADALGRHADAAVRGEVTAAAALAALDRDVDAMLEKRRWLLARGRLP